MADRDSELEKQKKMLLKFGQNSWDAKACHEDLEISGDNSLAVYRKRTNLAQCRSVFANHPISLSIRFSDIFYFEISIKQMKRHLFLGFADKQQKKLDENIFEQKGTYAIESEGAICINGSFIGKSDRFSYRVGDTVAFGISMATRQVFFTKNGHFLVPFNFSNESSSADDQLLLFPFVSLFDFDDQIEASFEATLKSVSGFEILQNKGNIRDQRHKLP
ncbi:hypothetical protein niasHT_034411 [Heterodera trifolii]|uniref:B30.2/SPRY domain-containing protein n=2 Tax=Heterodera TaxID=34509 RepID=A0ABD2HS32_9BILA